MAGIPRIFRAVLVWAWTAVFWAVLLTVYLLTLRQLPPAWTAALTRFWGRSALKLLGIRLVFENENTLKDARPRVVVINHQSTLDVLWGAAIVPAGFYAIGKKEVIFIPVLNAIWWALGFIRVDRSNTYRAVSALKGVAEEVRRHGRSLFIAPEGTRTPDGSIRPFKKGAFHIAVQARVPIHPVVVRGAFELMNKKEFTARRGEIRLRFLEPVVTEGLSSADVPALTERVRERMIEQSAGS